MAYAYSYTYHRAPGRSDVAVFHVEGVGALTIGPNPDAGRYTDRPDTSRLLQVVYGEAWPTGILDTRDVYPDAPTVAGLTLRGMSRYDGDRAVRWLCGARDYEWLWVFKGENPNDPLADMAPLKTRDAVRALVAALTWRYLRTVAADGEPMERACEGCGAEPGEPCRPGCLPAPEDDRATI